MYCRRHSLVAAVHRELLEKQRRMVGPTVQRSRAQAAGNGDGSDSNCGPTGRDVRSRDYPLVPYSEKQRTYQRRHTSSMMSGTRGNLSRMGRSAHHIMGWKAPRPDGRTAHRAPRPAFVLLAAYCLGFGDMTGRRLASRGLTDGGTKAMSTKQPPAASSGAAQGQGAGFRWSGG